MQFQIEMQGCLSFLSENETSPRPRKVLVSVFRRLSRMTSAGVDWSDACKMTTENAEGFACYAVPGVLPPSGKNTR
jgi:hypothetical protein